MTQRKKSRRAAALEQQRGTTVVRVRLLFNKQDVVSSWEVRRMSDVLPVVTVLFTFSTSKDK